jgi:hypothetical protein
VLKFVVLFFAAVLVQSVPSVASAGPGCDLWLKHPQPDVVLEGYAESDSDKNIKDVFTCGGTITDINRLGLLVPAVSGGHLAVTQFLLDQGADVSSDVFHGKRFNILREAISNIRTANSSWTDVASELVRRKVASDHLQEALAFSITAIPEQLPALVDEILLAGADPNRIENNDRPALLVISSWYDWARLFFETERHHRATAIELQQLAANYEHVASALINAGANPNADGYILFNYYDHWSIDQLKMILSKGANPNLRVTEWNMSVFERIVKDQNEECLDSRLGRIELLLQTGADANVPVTGKLQCKNLEGLLRKYGRVP